jgi:transposase
LILYSLIMTHKILLTPPIAEALKSRLVCEQSAKIYRRLLWLDLRRRGYRQKEIASLVCVSQAQLTNWSKIFALKGLDGLCCVHYEDRRPSRLMPYLQSIKNHVRDASVSTLSALQDWLLEEHGIVIEQSWLSRFIKKNSIVLTKRLV